jgi:YtoQ family protein
MRFVDDGTLTDMSTATGRQSHRVVAPEGLPPRRAYIGEHVWRVYLAGEIHTGWRDEIVDGISAHGLSAAFSAPVTRHSLSDDIGVKILGREDTDFWRDRKSSGINAIRRHVHLHETDIVVARFDDRHKELNVALEAGIAVGLGKPVISYHDGKLDHALKDLDYAAFAVVRTAEQVVRILRYVVDA